MGRSGLVAIGVIIDIYCRFIGIGAWIESGRELDR